jgi:hypothetical protein
MVVFAKYPGALMEIVRKLQEETEAETKNSGTSPGGTPAS